METLQKNNDYLDELNKIQRKAVTTTEGPVMVIAGPGSGKTRVLTYRIAHIIKSGVPPWQVLALTFTNKAAKEMKERIEKVIGPSANKVWAGTFHSVFCKILRIEAPKIGYPNNFTIYDTDDCKSLVNEIVKTMGLDPKVYINSIIRSRISAAKSNLIGPKQYANDEDYIGVDQMNKRPMIFKIYEKYLLKCRKSGAMDFDDLLLHMYRLLKMNPDNVRAKYQDKFKYFLVDEFQDTNVLQYSILKLFTNGENSSNNVCIVGDDAQSIYSFRGATIDNILQFEKDYPKVQVFKLEQNYRSTKHIVSAANKVISYNSNQIQKEIWTDLDEGNKIKLIRAMTDVEEGRRVASDIIEQKNRYNIPNSQIAILYRTNAQSRVFEEHLRRQNIPYRIYGGLSFYQRKEIKDVLAYLRLSVNSNDDEALKRVINYPKRGLGNSTVGLLTKKADQDNISMWDSIGAINFTARASKSMKIFYTIVKASQERAAKLDAFEAASFIIKKSGIIEGYKIENTLESKGRIENINALLDGIKEFTDSDEIALGEDENNLDRSLSSFLQTISLMTQADKESEDEDHVTLLSVHAAKGLEYRSVFVVGLEENLFPSFMSLSSPQQLDEERRLFYVAITRAKELLTLSCANSRYQYGNLVENDSSRFLQEIAEEDLDSSGFSFKKKSFGKSTRKISAGLGKARHKPTHIPEPENFTPSPIKDIEVGMRVLHKRFGPGQILSMDEKKKLATIKFESVNSPEKRILLQYARLQIIK